MVEAAGGGRSRSPGETAAAGRSGASTLCLPPHRTGPDTPRLVMPSAVPCLEALGFREGVAVPQSEDRRLLDLEARLEREDPRFTRAMRTGRPARPREYRRTRAWWVLAAGLASLGTGIAVADGLFIAAGLVLAGIAVERCASPPRRPEARGRKGGSPGGPPVPPYERPPNRPRRPYRDQ